MWRRKIFPCWLTNTIHFHLFFLFSFRWSGPMYYILCWKKKKSIRTANSKYAYYYILFMYAGQPQNQLIKNWSPYTYYHNQRKYQWFFMTFEEVKIKQQMEYLMFLWILLWDISHSSEIRGLRSTKCSSETLQNLLYFMYKKTHVVVFFSFFISCNFIFLPNGCPGLCRHRSGRAFIR